MSERLWKLLLVMVVAILIGVIFQERYKNQSLEEEKIACVDQMEKLANEAQKQQVTRMKEQQHEMDKESQRSSAELSALEEYVVELEDERTAWDEERDGLLIREKNLKQQLDDCRSQLKTTDSATTEEKIKRLRTESDLEELREELFLCNEKALTQEVLLARAESGAFKTEEVPTTGNSGYRAYPVLVKQFKAKAASKKYNWIVGIAMLNEDIFAVTTGSNFIERFDSTTLSTQETFVLKGYEMLVDLQPCKQSENLFVIDRKPTGTMCISSVDPYHKKIPYSWAVDRCIRRLSVTEDCHVIAACPDNKKIFEYTSAGQLIQEIIFKPEMGSLGPLLALKMTNGNFLVSYDGHYPFAGVSLAILNSNGDVLKSYSDSSQKLEHVIAMAIDTQGNILVADTFNGQVLLLSSDLEYKRDLLSKEYGIGMITAMLLDEVNGRLFVADCSYNLQGSYVDNARILVFDVQ